MFFLHEDFSMRRDIASWLIVFDRYIRKVRAECFKEYLSVFAAPDFDDVLVHVLIFIFPRADGNRLPIDLDAGPFTFGIRPTWTGIIWRDGKFGDAGVHDGKHLPITVNVKELGVDPAFILAIHPDPVVGIGATDEFDIRALNQSVEIQIFRAGSITAT